MGTAASTAGRATGTRRAEVLRRMDREWEALQQEAAARDACRRWAVGSGSLAGCATPADVLGRVPTDPDAVLLLLLRETARGDTLAGRVVLQALVPKVVLMASVDRYADVDDYVTALWCAVATYPVARRPTSVAANLALDTLKAVRRERRTGPDLAMSPHVVLTAADREPGQVVGVHRADRGPGVEEVLLRARDHGLVDPATGALLTSVYAHDVPGTRVAQLHGLTPGAVRSRCSRALRVLADHRGLLAAPP